MANEGEPISLDPITVTAPAPQLPGPEFTFSQTGAQHPTQTVFFRQLQWARAQEALGATIGGGAAMSVSPGGGEEGWLVNGNGYGADIFDFEYTPELVADPTYGNGPYGTYDDPGAAYYPEGFVLPQATPEGTNWPTGLSDVLRGVAREGISAAEFGLLQKQGQRRATIGYPGAPPQQMMAMIPRVPGIVTTGVTIRTAMRALLGSISRRVGQRVTAQNVKALVKRVGVEATALALGITAAEVLQLMLMAERPRRRRGITARQISTARSTIRRMTGFMAQVQQACSPAMRRTTRRARAHRAGCTCPVCR